MSKKKSIKGQLIIGIIISFTILQVVFGVVSNNSMKDFLQANIDSHNEHVADQFRNEINEDMKEPIQLVQELNGSFNGELDNENLEVIDVYLQSIVNTYHFISSIRLIDSSGNLLTEVPYNEISINTNYKYESFFTHKPINDEIVSSSIYYSSLTNQPTVTVAVNVEDYLMVLDMNLSIFDVLDQSESDSSLLSVSILDQYGNYLKDTDESNVSRRLRHPQFDAIKKMNADQNYFFSENGQANTLVVTKKVGLQDQWYLVLIEDYDQILKPLNDFGLYMMFFFSAYFILSLVIILLIMKNVMKDFWHLSKSTKAISEGVHDQAMLPFEYIEFQDLNDEFIQMRNTIELREQTILETNINLEETITQLEEEIDEHANTLMTLAEKEKDLERLLNEAKDSNMAKSYFLANMSHEIRTPINGIFGIINLLKMTEMDSEQRLYLNTIHSSAETLTTILNDILDFSKMELGKVKLNYSNFDLKVTLEDLKNLFVPTAMYKGIELKVDPIEIKNRFLIGDVNRIRQILSNLVGNAVKFTEQGSVTVTCTFSEENDGKVNAQFVVSDTGIGITKEEQRHIFDRFVQLENPINTHIKGTGLGLAISKKLVEQMGGAIRVECPENGGSNFIVDIPFELGEVINDSVEKISTEEEVYQQAQFVDLKILISDDDPTSLFMMKSFFEKMGAEVDIAKDGLVALELLNSEIYDLILMDANMPNLNGFEATKEIRNRRTLSRKGNEIPIIAITAFTIEDEKNEFIAAGMDECISKPVNFELLLEIILSMGVEFEIRDNVVPIEGKDIISETLKDLSNDSGFDESTCLFILRTFVDQAKEILTDMDMMLRDDMDSQTNSMLGKLLHKLKGSAGNVRAKDIMTLSFEAEAACMEGNIQKVKENKANISELIEIYAEYLNTIFME